MASLLKSQILKHLSKFTKNLSPDKINLSTLKGEGELSNLELDENVLTELLDLPPWLNIKQASCNRVSIKIQWTKLKSQPILLVLDEVVVETETCEKPRPPPKHDNDGQAGSRAGGKYGFIESVLDGIYVRVNSVLVKLVSNTFQASVELSRLTVRSVTPIWKESQNLRHTRIKESERDAILLFKEIEWQNTRINASSVNSGSSDYSSPLRIIANQAKIRITTKKRLSDSSIIASRLVLHLADLLWVLAKTQMREAILYANSLSKIIENSAQQSKQRAAEKLQEQVHHNHTSDHLKTASPSHQTKAASEVFNKYDVVTTSYHLNINPINLHLCDDTTAGTVGNKERLWNIEGGSMQITMYKLSVDFYPFHQAGGERKKWFDYKETGTRNIWVQKLFSEFRTDAMNMRKVCVNSPVNQKATNSKSSSMHTTGAQRATSSPAKGKSTRLLESCFVVKISDLAIYMVSTSSTKQSTLHKFLASDKKQLNLPPDTATLHIEYTNYFFPEEIQYPVPDANMYMMLNPLRLTIDYTTLLWANYFFMDLSSNVDMVYEVEEQPEHMDIKIEAIMPRIILPAESKVEGQPDRPEYVQVVASKLSATNVRVEEKSTRKDLQTLIQKYEGGHLFYTQQFPNDDSLYEIIPTPLLHHANSEDNAYINENVKSILQAATADKPTPTQCQLHSNTLKKKSACDIWCVSMDQVWLEFLGVNNYKSRPIPFVEAFPLTFWLAPGSKADVSEVKKDISRENRASLKKLREFYSSEDDDGSGDLDKAKKKMADKHVLVDINSKVNIQINHYQYLFLMRLNESMTKFQSQLNRDILLFTDMGPSSFCIPLLIPGVELAVVCPYLPFLETFNDTFNSPAHIPTKDAENFSPEHRKIKIMGHKKQASNSAPNRISINTTDSTSSLEDNPNISITKSMSDSTIHAMPTDTCDFTQEVMAVTDDIVELNHNAVLQRKASSTNAIPTEVQHQEIHATNSFGGDSGVFMESRGSLARYMKPSVKNVTSVFNSLLMDKLQTKSSNENLSMSDDDNLSIFTDQSDDDFVDLSLEECECPVFSNENRYETASVTDTYSDDGSSVYADSITNKSKELASAVVFKLDNLEVLMYGDKGVSTTAAQLSCITTCCPGNVTLEEIQAKLSAKGFFSHGNDSEEQQNLSPPNFPVKFKLISEADVNNPCPSTLLQQPIGDNEKKDCMVVHAANIPLQLKMSSVTALAEFIEDEKIPEIIPMKITLSDVLLILSEDRPSINVGAPSAPPQNIHINTLLIEKDLDGIIQIKSLSAEPVSNGVNTQSHSKPSVAPVESSSQSLSSSFASSLLLLQSDNMKLNQQLADMNKLKKENEMMRTQLSMSNGELEKLRNENIKLVDRIQNILSQQAETLNNCNDVNDLSYQTRVTHLEEELEMANKEKESLLSTMKLLQDELLSSERKNRQRMMDGQY